MNISLFCDQDAPEDQSGGEEDFQSIPPHILSTVQVLIQQIIKLFHDPKSWHHFSLISSGAAFTPNSQEIQGRFSTETGIISELAYKYILHISNNHFPACRSCIIWIIWPAECCNSPSSSRPPVPAGSNFDEIRLKQVSSFPFGRFHHILYLHCPS